MNARQIVSSAKSHTVLSANVPVYSTRQPKRPNNPVISHNDGKVIKMAKSTNGTPRVTVSEMAKALGTSTTHIYNALDKFEVKPLETKGRTSFYDAAFLEKLKTVPRRLRKARREAAPAKPEVKTEQPSSLLERIAKLESELAATKSSMDRLAGLETKINKIAEILGA